MDIQTEATRMWCLLVLLGLLATATALAQHHPSCRLCPGEHVINPDSTIWQDLTCAKTDAFLKAGCLNRNACSFLQGYAKSFCCGKAATSSATASTEATCSDAPTKDLGVICYDTVQPSFPSGGGEPIRQICIEKAVILCFGQINSHDCSGRSKLPVSLCAHGEGGYRLDCSNVNKDYQTVDVCGVTVKTSRKKNGGNAGSHSSYNSSNDSDDAVLPSTIVIVVVLLVLRIALCQRRAEARRQFDAVPRTDNNSVELVAHAIPVSGVASPGVLRNIPHQTDVLLVSAEPVHATATSRAREFFPLKIIAQDPLANSIHLEAGKGSLDTFVKEIDKFRSGAWDLRAMYIGLVVDDLVLVDNKNGEKKVESFWDDLVEEMARTYTASSSSGTVAAIRLVQGSHLMHCAWEVRGSDWGYTVTAEAREKFHSMLSESREALLNAAALDTEDPTPFAFLQTIGMALSGREAAEKWLQEARSRDQFNLSALSKHRYLLMRKWLGRHDTESLDFARRIAMEECPPDHISRMVLIQALKEQTTDGAWTKAKRNALMREPWVTESTLDIYRCVFVNREAPLRTFFEKYQFEVILGWLLTLVRAGLVDQKVFKEARKLLMEKPPLGAKTSPEIV